MRTRTRFPALTFIASLLAGVCLAQAPNFRALQWRSIGSFRGGRAITATGVPGNPSLFYFGAVGGGIWKSTDAGTVWNPIFDGQSVASIGALEVAPSNPQVLYAGTGEADIRSDIAMGDGVYKSTDGGAHWQNIGLRDTLQIGRIAIDPADPNLVYVAALGHAYGPNPERGVFRTKDGGKTWEKVLEKGPDIGAVDLALAPDAPGLLYATTWRARRTPWSQYAPNGGPGSGLYKSADGGTSWTEVKGRGLPAGEWGRAGVAIARGTHGQRVYVLLEAQAKESGLYRSDDGGETWTRSSSDPRITSRQWYFGFIAVDPRNPDIVYIPNVALMRSVDGGRTFIVLRGAPGGDDYHSLWIDPADSARMILGSDQGVSVSLNTGATWSTWYNQPTGQLYHVATDNQFPYNVCGSQQDSGTVCVPSRTNHGSISERDFSTVGGNEAGWAAPDPLDPNIVFASDTYGAVSRFDKRTGQSQVVTPWPVPAFGANISGRKYRDPWTPPLLFSPADPKALYLGTQFLLKTTDGGLHWNQVSPDLTGDQRGSASALACADRTSLETAKPCGYGVIYSIAPSPLHADQIWTGSDSGLVFLTRNGGKNWNEVTPPGISPWSKITHIEASHTNPAEAWAAVDRHRLDDYAPHLYRTRDYGKSWTAIVQGLPERAFLNAIREDPVRKGLLFAAAETGVFASLDDGDHWFPLQLNLPPASVRDLVIHGKDLAAATHGRAFWILDDITPLRTWAAEVADSDPYFFPPAAALRVFSEPFQGTPLPPEIPAAKNPPDGAILDYWLRSVPADGVKLEVFDRQNRLVRTISSTDPAPPVPHDEPIADIWFTVPPVLTAAPGHNRFVWDLRYQGPQAAGGAEDPEIGPVRGPLVLPGDYTLKLTANHHTVTRDLHVDQDPRSPVPLAVLEQQRDLALQVVSDLRRAAELAPRLQGEIPRAQLSKIQTALSSALVAITSADRLPPVQAIEVFEQTRAELQTLTRQVTGLP